MNCQVPFQKLQENFKVRVVPCTQMNSFETLLTEYIRDNERSVSAFARSMGVSHTAVNNVLNGESRATAEFVIKAAQAMDQDPVSMLRLAGYLSPVSSDLEDEAELLYAWRSLQPQQQEVIKQAIRGLVDSNTSVPQHQRGPPQERGEEEALPPRGEIVHDFSSLEDPLRRLFEDYLSIRRSPEEADRRLQILLTLARDALREYQEQVDGDTPASHGASQDRELFGGSRMSQTVAEEHNL